MNAACKKQRSTCWSIIITSEEALESADARQVQRSTRSIAVPALCFTRGLRGSRGRSNLVKFHWSIVVPGELLMWRGSYWDLHFLLICGLKLLFWSSNQQLTTYGKTSESSWPSSVYLSCLMIEMSPFSGSKPFMIRPPFLARGILRPCSTASFSFSSRSSVKLTETVLLGRVSSGAGLNPRSEDSLRLIEAARWNLS